jgi:arginase
MVTDQGARGISPIKKTLSVIGARVNEGQNWYTGVETAPSAFRQAGLSEVAESLGYVVTDAGDIAPDGVLGEGVEPDDSFYSPELILNAQCLGRSCGKLFNKVQAESARSNFVLTLGGDHSIAAGTISALKVAKKDLAVVWVDAHADCNTPETSPSGNFHGMPVGLLLGWFKKAAHPEFAWIKEYLKDPLKEERLAFIGLRDVDEAEKKLLRESNILVYSMIDVERLGIARIMEEIIDKLSPGGCRPIHLSFDIDGMDPVIAPGTGTRARGGLSFREGRYICSRLAETGRLESMDLVEVNPTIDTTEKSSSKPEHGDNPLVRPETSITVKLGIDLIEFALGKTLT